MWLRKLREIFDVITPGGGTIEYIVPRDHLLLPIYPRVARFFADSPTYMRLLGLTRIGLGVWPNLRQYREE